MEAVQNRSMYLRKILCCGALVAVASFVTAQAAWANGGVFFDDMDQAFKGQKVSYFGTVRDNKGKAIPDAKVLITVARDQVQTYTTASDNRGRYRTPSYADVDTRRVQLFAEKPGYKFSQVVQIRGPKKIGDPTEADIIMAPLQ